LETLKQRAGKYDIVVQKDVMKMKKTPTTQKNGQMPGMSKCTDK
jgi:hypothetical protein